jgi:hypothetical protein
MAAAFYRIRAPALQYGRRTAPTSDFFLCFFVSLFGLQTS